MGDAIKIATKAALIVVISTAVIVLFGTISIPGLDLTLFLSGFSKAMAIFYHWVPGSRVIIPIALGLLSWQLAYFLFQFAMIATRWIMKVNE